VAYILGASMLAEYQITVLVSGSVIILFEITQNVNVKIISSVEVSNKSQIAKEIFEANYRLFISTTGTAFSIFIICQATETYFFEFFNPSIALLILLAMVGKFIYLETSALLISSKNTKPIFQGSFVAMLSIVVGSMVLVPFWGAYGAATATAAALSIQAIVSSAFVSKIGSFGMELKKFIGSCAGLLIFLHLETRVAIEFTFLSLIAFFLCSVYFGIKFVKFYRGHKVPNSKL
jgi:O-antigen/teichoic acid export membrane protein